MVITQLMALTVGDRIAHYDVTALIGEGGMGQVYQATDTKLNRQLALKILPEAVAADPDRSDGGFVSLELLARNPGSCYIERIPCSGSGLALSQLP